MTTKLTDVFVENLPFAGTSTAIKRGYGESDSYTIGDSEVRGLAIKVGFKRKVWQVSVRPLGASPIKEKIGNWMDSFLGKDAKTGEERAFVLNVANARANARIRIAALRDGRRLSAEKRVANRKAESENRETLRWLIEEHKNNWVKKGADGNPKKNSLIGINTACRHLSDWLDMPFRQITPEMVLKRFNEISQEKNKQGKPKRTTANNVFRDLRTVFNNWIALYPDSGFKNPTTTLSKKRHETSPREGWIKTVNDAGQFIRWWKAVEAERSKTIRDYLIITLLQGARESETARLEWKHLDFEEKKITYSDTKNGGDYEFPMSPMVYDILISRYTDEDRHATWVFPASKIRKKGVPLNHIATPPADAVRRIAERASVKWTMHDLRRTFVNTLLHLGIEQRQRDYMMKHTIRNVSIHYEDLAVVLLGNFTKYENYLMSLLNAAATTTSAKNGESADTREEPELSS